LWLAEENSEAVVLNIRKALSGARLNFLRMIFSLQIAMKKCTVYTCTWRGYLQGARAVAQGVSRWLPTAAARVRVREACGVCGGQSVSGAGFLRVLRFPLPIILPISPSSYSPGAGTIGLLVAAVPSRPNWTPPPTYQLIICRNGGWRCDSLLHLSSFRIVKVKDKAIPATCRGGPVILRRKQTNHHF
jgi:hypothetical protein